MSAVQEIERKFLVPTAPDLSGYVAEVVRQGYITVGGEGHEVRVRQKGQGYFITVKSKGTLARAEYETALSQEQFDTLWPATEGRRLEKTRYTGTLSDGFPCEVDIFEGALTGLVMVEVEFAKLEAAKAFSPPDWFGTDVTEDKRYKNSALASAGTLPPGT
ncbi:CYTH domain-containing protein [Donghicola tyrosinivorans]|uniref:CYTH domain-containing protein n=1 Tax=Donghicola tyrosinivorans TaxID=1652492 RepID=A0A2T0WRK8_9RHOB|nr:CYTH domain-containing protein [Donghicola tyrosinivorans]PRY89341.1 CYTH domain-containing protein [Donghicola tyrosinivorans]